MLLAESGVRVNIDNGQLKTVPLLLAVQKFSRFVAQGTVMPRVQREVKV
jgi:hypothetical protein